MYICTSISAPLSPNPQSVGNKLSDFVRFPLGLGFYKYGPDIGGSALSIEGDRRTLGCLQTEHGAILDLAMLPFEQRCHREIRTVALTHRSYYGIFSKSKVTGNICQGINDI